jgi:hypothetical protein
MQYQTSQEWMLLSSSEVNEFVPDGFAELLPPVLFVGLPGQRNRDRLCCWVVLRDACLPLCSV